jgi:hypothetical protein
MASISDIICAPGKQWVSEGAVRHSSPALAKPEHYPKVGMKFTGTQAPFSLPKDTIHKFVKDGATGQFNKKEIVLEKKTFKTVTFKIDQRLEALGGTVPAIDPETNKKTVLFSDNYVRAYEKLRFYECGDNKELLVSEPMLLADEAVQGKIVMVTFTVEIFTDTDGKQYMLQRSFWDGEYVGTYCCG